MGFGGGTGSANIVLKNNRNLLKKRSRSRRISFVSAVNEKWVDPKTASFDQLMEIRTRLRDEHHIRERKVILFTLLGLIICALGVAVIPWELIFTNVH